jgi:hypothetical protein
MKEMIMPLNEAIRSVILAGLLACLTAASLPTGAAPAVPPAEQDDTKAVHGDFRNPLTLQQPAPAEVGTTPAFFSGELHGQVGSPPSASAPVDDAGRHLVRVAFGQAFGSGIPYPQFASVNLARAEKLLYYDQADAIPPEQDAPGQGQYSRDRAAYRYRDLIYEQVQIGQCAANPEISCVQDGDCPELDTCGPASDYVVNLLEARIGNGQRTMDDFYGAAERSRSMEAERTIRNALKYAPQDPSLRNALLDVYYDRIVAELAFAKARRIDATRQRILDPPTGMQVLDAEIAAFEQALGDENAPGGFRYALRGYFELLNDPLGVDVGSFDPAAEGAGFGYYLLQQELPGRSLRAATYLNSGVPTPVTPAGAQPGDAPPVLYDGYKDLVLLFDMLGEYADATVELALRYLARGGQDDGQNALALVAEAQKKLYLEGSILLGLAPSAGAAANSGLDAARGRWQQGISRLAEFRNLAESDANVLGYDEDFLMLVVTDDPDPAYTTYDKFLEEVHNGVDGVIDLALEKFDRAVATYDSYRGNEDQLAQQFQDLNEQYDARIYEIVGTSDPSDPAYATPLQNVGSELQLQKLSIDIARNRVTHNAVRLQNVKRQIEIEVDRAGKELGIRNMISRVILSYGNQQAALTDRIGQIEADQILVQGATDAASQAIGGIEDVIESAGLSLIAGFGQAAETAINTAYQVEAQKRKTALEVQKEKKAADERAEINDLEGAILAANSKAKIKAMMLEMHEIAVDSQKAALVVAQESARLASLMGEWAELERRKAQANVNLAGRYFADPIHRLRVDVDMDKADRFFRNAQEWVFFLARALEYEWNIRLSELPGGGHEWPTASGNHYSVDSIYEARNADDLEDIVLALEDYNLEAQTIARGTRYSWFSFRDDFLNLDGDVGAFRAALQALIDANPDGKLVFNFSTAQEIAGFPLYSPDNWNDKIEWVKVNIPGATDPITGLLSYGGTAFIRNQVPGVVDPANPDRVTGEERIYPTRYWYKNVLEDRWEFTDAQRASAQILPTSGSQEIPPGVTEIRDFQQRSVAATGWTLELPAGVDVSQFDDIELYIKHTSATRQ